MVAKLSIWIVAIGILSGCASQQSYNVSPSIYEKEVSKPFSVVTETEWKEIVGGLSQKKEHEKALAMTNIGSQLSLKSAELINRGDTNRGFRLALKGSLMSRAASDMNQNNILMPIATQMENRQAIEQLENGLIQRGLTREVYAISLVNLANSISMPSLAENYRMRSSTPKEKTPSRSSKEALIEYLESLMDGGSLGTYWCKSSAILRSELFSPRSYTLIGDAGKDLYMEDTVGGAYRNFYKVRIESSNKGGRPIIKDWSIGVEYGEYLYGNRAIGWCISSIQ